MSRPKLQSVTMASIRCLLALCVFGLLFGSQTAASMQTAAKSPRPFAIEGEIDGLYPGARVPLNIRVTNPHDNPLRVQSVGVEVQDSDTNGCGREWVRPGRNVTISTLVPPRSTSSLSYPVSMVDSAPAVCQGATWALNFTGTGTVSGGEGPSDGGNGNNTGDEPAPGDGSVLPFTGFNLAMILGVALASILSGVLLVMWRRSGDQA
jgi:hypothetical protein